MLKAAIEKIQELAEPKILRCNDHTFAVGSGGNAVEILPEQFLPKVLELTSLDALVKMIQTEASKAINGTIFVQVRSYLEVVCYAGLMPKDDRYARPSLYVAKAIDVPGWEPSVKLPFDQAAVALMTRFASVEDDPSDDRDYTLRLLSSITSGAQITYSDNGIASTIVTSKGVQLQQRESIKPVVNLRPYRTFQEVAQPRGKFLIRLDERGISFIEADGGMWKLAARNTVKAWLEAKLEPMVTDGTVVIML